MADEASSALVAYYGPQNWHLLAGETTRVHHLRVMNHLAKQGASALILVWRATRWRFTYRIAQDAKAIDTEFPAYYLTTQSKEKHAVLPHTNSAPLNMAAHGICSPVAVDGDRGQDIQL